MRLNVIIPVYNVEEEFIRPCLDSILAQTNGCWRAVLVDDGSTNGAERICEEYAKRDARFHVIHQANAGVGAARNAGIELVLKQCPDGNGWIWFVDADDVVHPRAVEVWQRNVEKMPEIDFWHFEHEKCKPSFRFDDAEELQTEGREIESVEMPRLCVWGGVRVYRVLKGLE